MALEAATFIADLVATNPVGATDPVAQGDDHLRLLKAVLQATIPFSGLVTATHTEINQLHGGVLSSIGNGTVTAPAYGFAADPNTGIYRVGADQVGFAAGGQTPFYVDTTHVYPNSQIQALDGAAGTPEFSFVADPDSGIYRVANDQLGIALGGNLIYQFTTTGLFGDVGSVASPAFSFRVDPDTGVYRIAANQVGFAAGGQTPLYVDATHVYPNAQTQAPDGTAALPTYSFVSDPDTGMMRNVSGLNLVKDGVIFIQGTDTNVFIGQPSGASGITLAGSLSITNTNVSTGANAGAQGAPPATVAGYIIADINGTARKIPYYNN